MSTRVMGDHQLLMKLERLKKSAQNKIIRKGNSKAIRPVIQAAKAGVRKTSRTISKSIGVKHKFYKQNGVAVAIAGPRRAASTEAERPHVHFITGGWRYRKHVPANTAHLVERGTKPHQYTIKIGKSKIAIRHPGTKAKPFMEPALERQKHLAVQIFHQVARQEIMRIAVRRA